MVNHIKEVKSTQEEIMENDESDMILEYYKDWDSESAPILMIDDLIGMIPEEIESEDQKKLGFLRKKYG